MPEVFYTIGQRDKFDTWYEYYGNKEEVRKILEETATDIVAEGEVFFVYEIKQIAMSKIQDGKATWLPT